MKTINFKNAFLITLIMFGLSSAQISNAQSRLEKKIAANERRAEKNGVLDKKAKEQNCFAPDNKEYYTANGMIRIKRGEKILAKKTLL